MRAWFRTPKSSQPALSLKEAPMAVSKRLRYEILRRDNHACRYCGATAPDAKLNVDHVIPQSLGGHDKPDNLVTSCADCNAGKTSSMPNAMPVADVDQEAFRRAAAEKKAHGTRRETHDPETGIPTCWSFRDVELALVEDAWQSAWSVASPDGPSFSEWEEFSSQRQLLADRRVHIGVMLAAAAMAGSQRSTRLVWGVPSKGDTPRCDEEFRLGCDVVLAWETAWEQAANDRPRWGIGTLLSEEVTAAIEAGHDRHTLIEAAKAAGRHQSFYLPEYLPKIQVAGGDL